jgi:hypothetical protein
LTVRARVVVAVRLPEVPVMVTVVGPPPGAVAFAVSVNVLDVVELVGLKDAVTPLGRPEARNATVPVKPFVGVTVMMLVPPAAPGLIVRLLGASDKVKFGGGVTVRAIVVVCVKLPDVPVMVTVAVPAVAEPLAVSVSTLVVVVLVGLKDAVTPLGRPEAVKFTVPVKPFVGVTVIVLVPPARVGVIVRLLGAADRVKFGGPVTVRVMVVVAVRLPEVPVMVTVAVPGVADPLAVSDSTLVVVVLVGLKDAVTPLGRPEAAKLTLPVKPPAGVTVMVLVPAAPPGVIDRLLGAAERVKLGVTARLNSQIPRP